MTWSGLADYLRAHAWVDDARCGEAHAPGALLALNRQGIDTLCSAGRQQLTNTLQAYINNAGYVGAPLTWRLFDTLPTLASPKDIDALLQAPLPRDATLLGEYQYEGSWTLALRVPLDLIYFPGHFPQAPVLPGVVQVGWALSLASQRMGTPARCHVMEALKFQHVLRPGERVDLTLRYDATRHKLHFTYRHGDMAYSSGRLAWSA